MRDIIQGKYGALFLGLKSYPIPSFTCPCCGFITLHEDHHVYEICEVCDWEDDPVQFEFPDSPS